MIDRYFIYFSYSESQKGIINKSDIPNVLQVESELLTYFDTHVKYLSTSGLMFLRLLDCYFYVMKVKSSDLYLLSSHPIGAAMSFYFNMSHIENHFVDIYGDVSADKIYNDPSVRSSLLMQWGAIFTSLTEIKLPNPYDMSFNDEMVQYFSTNFGNNLSELFYALSLQVPVIIVSNSNDPSLEQLYYRDLLPFLHIFSGDTPSSQIYHVYLVKDVNFDYFDQYLYLNKITGESSFNVTQPALSGLDELIEEALEFHKANIMPFQMGIYNGLFWNIQKIYGVLSLHEGKIDFTNYLHKEKLHFIDLLVQLFHKMAFLKDLQV